MKNVTIAVLVIALAVTVVTLIARAQSSSVDFEVRISARERDDGRIEVALQQRAGEQWQDRILPLARLIPSERERDAWYNTTPVVFQVAVPTSPVGEVGQAGSDEASSAAADSSPGDGGVSGTGPSVVTATLEQGTYLVSISVANNNTSFGADNFIITASDTTGGSALVANEIVTRWESVVVVRIGRGLLDLAPGKILFEIDCAPGAQWTLRFERQ